MSLYQIKRCPRHGHISNERLPLALVFKEWRKARIKFRSVSRKIFFIFRVLTIQWKEMNLRSWYTACYILYVVLKKQRMHLNPLYAQNLFLKAISYQKRSFHSRFNLLLIRKLWKLLSMHIWSFSKFFGSIQLDFPEHRIFACWNAHSI